jgi:hypothetical protein
MKSCYTSIRYEIWTRPMHRIGEIKRSLRDQTSDFLFINNSFHWDPGLFGRMSNITVEMQKRIDRL